MKKRLSILIYSLSSGGAEKVVSILLGELKKEYEITLVLMNDKIFYHIPEDIKIVYLENSNSNESGLQKLLKLPLLAWKYKKLNKSEISFSFMNRSNYINILAKLMGMKNKVFISERAMPSMQHANGIQGRVNRFLIKKMYKYADVITANSIGNSKDLENNFNCDNVLTINNPLDIEKIKNLSKEYVNFRDEKFTLITVGRLDAGKNHTLMIEAMQEIDAKLYIIGDGALSDLLKEKIENLNLKDKVFLLGSQLNPYKYLAKADCFIFSSNHEGFPNVLLEALACALPVISTDCQSGPREILAPDSNINFQLKNNIELAKFGILTPVNDFRVLQQAILLIKNDNYLRHQYIERAKDRIYDFDVKTIAKKFENILNV